MSDILQALYRGDALHARELAASAPLDIFEAAALGDEDRVRALLAADRSLACATAEDGFTALHLAAFFGQAATVRLLLDADAVPDAVSRNAMSVRPLHAAAVSGNAIVMSLLLAAGADPNARQEHGFTPLHARALRGDVATSRLLVESGADPALPCDDGRTALDIARAQGHSELASMLETIGAR